MSVTAIFGGTFNPMHNGHYEMLDALERDPAIERILIMPDKIPPHKICDFLAEDSVRIDMCRIAAKEFSKAELCLIEFDREGKSYTYDTVILLKKMMPDAELAFVCGGDMLVTFDGWYRYEELLSEIPFIVFRRSDIDDTLFNNCVEKFKNLGMRITVKREVISCVSSTEIRKDFSTAKKLLPPKILNFLNEKGVYSE